MKSLRIYIACKYERKEAARALMAAVRAAGHVVTHDWTQEAEGADLEACALADVDGVCSADVLVIEPTDGCKGAWVEFGIAVACLIPIVVVGQGGCIFERLPRVHHCTADEVPAVLATLDPLFSAMERRGY